MGDYQKGIRSLVQEFLLLYLFHWLTGLPILSEFLLSPSGF